MHGLSEPTQALIDQAHRIARDPGPSPAADRDLADALARIAATDEVLAIPQIISLVLDRRPAIADAAGSAIATLRKRIAARDVGRFDRMFREPASGRPERIAWRPLQPPDLARVAAVTGGPAVLQFAMCDPSGYVREAAIRRAALCTDGSEIPFLLLRAADWVPEVRDAAQEALRDRLRADRYHDLIAALPVLDQVRARQRLGSASVLDDIEAWFTTPDAVAPLLAASAAPDRCVRRAAYPRLFASSYADQRSVLAAALGDPDPEIQARTARRLLDAGRAVFLAWSAPLLRASHGAIRCRTAQRLDELAQPLPWPDLLLDRHAGVRAIAQARARDAGVDPADTYRTHVATDHAPKLHAALHGLRETGGGDDDAIVEVFFDHDRPAVRCAALRAFASFRSDDLVDLCLAALMDPSPSVTHAARDLLLARPRSVSPTAAWARFVAAPTISGQLNVLAVLARLGYWDALPYLLRAFLDGTDPIRTAAAGYLARWLARRHRVVTTPSAATLVRLRGLVEAPGLGVELRGALHAVLANRAS